MMLDLAQGNGVIVGEQPSLREPLSSFLQSGRRALIFLLLEEEIDHLEMARKELRLDEKRLLGAG